MLATDTRSVPHRNHGKSACFRGYRRAAGDLDHRRAVTQFGQRDRTCTWR